MQSFSILSHSSPSLPLIIGTNPRTNHNRSKGCSFRALSCSKTLDKPQISPPTIYIADARRAAIARIKVSTDLDSDLKRKYGGSVVRLMDLILSIEAEFSADGVLQVHDFNFLLRYFGKSKSYHEVSKVFDLMLINEELLAGCTKLEDGYSKAMQLVNELKANGLHMDNVIYGNLLAICASNNLCEEAEIFFQQMKNEGCTPNLFHYSSLLNAYSENGNYVKSELLIKEMKSLGLAPNKVILTTLLKVYAKGGLFEKSRELLAELEALGYAGDEMPYCLLMDNLARTGHIQEAKAILAEMKKKDVKSNGYSYSIMISALCRSGKFQEARRLAKDFEANYAKYDLVMLNSLLRVYCNAGDMDSAMQMLSKMDELAISPDWNTFHILIKYFCKEKLYHLAYRTIEDMHGKGHPVDEELCTSLILQLGWNGSPSEALSVYNMLRYSKRKPCKSLHQKVLDILVAAGLLKEAYVVMKDNAKVIPVHSLEKFAIAFMKSGNINLINDVLKAFQRSGCTIDMEVFRIAISRYVAKPEKKNLLLQLLQWMSGQGYVVDSSSRNLLLRKSHFFGEKQLIAEMLSRQHVESRKLKNH